MTLDFIGKFWTSIKGKRTHNTIAVIHITGVTGDWNEAIKKKSQIETNHINEKVKQSVKSLWYNTRDNYK